MRDSADIIKWTLIAYGLLMGAWVLAWMLKVRVDAHLPWLAGSAGSFVYWTTAKVLVWILPALWLIRLSGRTLKEVFNFANWRAWLAWGGGIGALIALAGLVPSYLSGGPLLPAALSFALLNVLVIAPVFEEFLARGAILGNLEQGYAFWTANVAASLMFVGMHLPGWYFMGSLAENLGRPLGGAVSIFVLGLAFGYAVHKSRSVMGGVLAHALNNLAPNP